METALFQNVNTIVFYVLILLCVFCWFFSKEIFHKIDRIAIRHANRLVYFFYSRMREMILDSVFFKNKTRLIMLFIILLFFKTETAIGFYWFPVALIIGMFLGAIIATRDTDGTGYTAKYVVPDIVYTISSIGMTAVMFLFFYKNNLMCGSTVNTLITILIYLMVTERSLFLGKHALVYEGMYMMSGENDRIKSHLR
jgi:hypothetical protein